MTSLTWLCRRSDYSDDDQYGLEPGSGGYDERPQPRRSESSSSDSDVLRYVVQTVQYF